MLWFDFQNKDRLGQKTWTATVLLWAAMVVGFVIFFSLNGRTCYMDRYVDYCGPKIFEQTLFFFHTMAGLATWTATWTAMDQKFSSKHFPTSFLRLVLAWFVFWSFFSLCLHFSCCD